MRPITILFSFLIFTSLTGQFSPRQPITTTASTPSAIAVADLNSDGIPDIVAAHKANGMIAYYPGMGAGVFGDQIIIGDSLTEASACVVADIDGDGIVDVIAAGHTADRVVWYRNLGAGIFGAENVISSTADGPWGLEAADLDQDGLIDVVIACKDSNRIVWHKNLGNGIFGAEQLVTILTEDVRMVKSGDLDGDGDLDLVSASAVDNKVAWYENLGNGNFGPQQLITTGLNWSINAYCVDLDGDGDLDVLSAHQTPNLITWSANDATGTFGSPQTVAVAPSVLRYCFPADVDGDGHMDVVAASSGMNGIFWYANNGSGEFGPAQIISNSVNNPSILTSADADGDGDMDVLTSSTDGKLHRFANNGNGEFGTPSLISSTDVSNPTMSLFADLNSNGLKDALVLSNTDGKILWYPNNGNGGFGGHQVIAVLPSPRHIHSADLNGDGHMDVTVLDPLENEMRVFLNDGTGQFGSGTSYPAPGGPYSLITGDVDGDGDLDIVFGMVDNDGVKVAFNDGNGQFQMPSLNFWNTLNRPAQLFDVDGDGDLDLILGNAFGNVYEWFANDGNGQFSTGGIVGAITAGTIWSMDNGDIDGDGWTDLITSDSDFQIVWFRNEGGGVFSVGQVIPVPGGPRSLKLTDLNGNGQLDVVFTRWFSNGGRKVSYMFNDGQGAFGPIHNIDEDIYAPLYIDAADMDGDGDPDLLVTTNLSNMVWWYKNYMSSPFRIEGRVFHDLNANGIHETGEPAANWVGVATTPASSTALSGINGTYTIHADSGAYNVALTGLGPWWQVTNTPPAIDVQLTADQPVAMEVDLGVVALVDTTVIVASTQRMPAPCSGTARLYLTVRNMGTRIEQGTILFDLSPLFTYTAASPEPDLIDGYHFEWSFEDLQYEEVRQISMDVIEPDVMYIGDTLHCMLTVQREDGFGTVTDTIISPWSRRILCAYDPNDKSVTPVGWGPNGVVSIDTPFLDYTIRFQNTGNAPAFDVVLRDQLSAALVTEGIQVLGYSHVPDRVAVEAGGELVVEFRNIMLPDSASAPLESQGFFSFRMPVRQDLASGTVVANTAGIYFDLNPPIITNTTVNMLIDCALFTAWIDELGEGLLMASPGAQYQWYFNGEPMEGATSPFLQPVAMGEYMVRTTSIHNCIAYDSILILSTGMDENTGSVIHLWPNPTRDRFWLSVGAEEDHRFEVLDAIGRKRAEGILPGMGTLELDASSWGPGLYMVRMLNSNGEAWTRRVVIH